MGRLHLIVLSVLIQKYFTALKHSLPMKSRKRLVCDVLDALPHMLVLFMMSLIQTAGHKTSALTVVFSQLLTQSG